MTPELESTLVAEAVLSSWCSGDFTTWCEIHGFDDGSNFATPEKAKAFLDERKDILNWLQENALEVLAVVVRLHMSLAKIKSKP